jgi:outer membrane protein TolC
MKRALILVLLLAGCASDRGISHRATPTEPAALAAEKSLGAETASGEWPALDWWKRFGDAQLDALVDEALAASPNLRLAQARLDQARSQAQIAGAPLLPQVNAEASVNRTRFSGNYIFPPPIGGSTFTTTQLALNASYEVDFWGRNRAPRRPRRSPRAWCSPPAWRASTCSSRAPTNSSISRGARSKIASMCRA